MGREITRMDLVTYLDAARARIGAKSDADLARAIGVAGPTLLSYRRGLATPSSEKMVRLASLAGVSPDLALIDRMEWQADGAASRDIVARIRASIAATAALILLFFFVFPPSPIAETCDTDRPCSVYYGKAGVWKSLWKGLLNASLR